MQELQKRQKEQQKFLDLIKEGAGKTVEERVEYNKDLEYNKHANLFAVSYSSIHKAACDGSVSGIKYFMTLKSKPRIKIDELDKFGLRPIHYAAERGHNEAIKTMLELKHPVDATTVDGMTAMMYAGKDGRVDTMKLLFEHKANLQMVNRAGMSVAHFAAQNDFVEVFGVLLDMNKESKEAILQMIEQAEINGDAPPQAVAAAAKGSAKASTTPAKKKAAADSDSDKDSDEESDAKEEDESIPGKAAAHVLDDDDDDIDDAERLRRQFRVMLNLPDTAIIDIASKNGTRPLHVAATFNAIHTVAFLIKNGADLNAADSAGETPLHKAARRNNFDVYRLLAGAGAKNDVKNFSRETPKELLADLTKA